MDDVISRQAAIDALDEYFVRIGELKRRGLNKGEKAISLDTVGVIKTLPSAQPYTIHSDGRLWVTVDDIDKVRAVVVDEHKSKFCKQFYEDAQPEPCEDAVSREVAQRLFGKALTYKERQGKLTWTTVEVKQFIADFVEDLPSVTPKQRMGKWIYHIDDLFPAESTMECNQCHAEQPLICDDEFCPNCGADMREVTE